MSDIRELEFFLLINVAQIKQNKNSTLQKNTPLNEVVRYNSLQKADHFIVTNVGICLWF